MYVFHVSVAVLAAAMAVPAKAGQVVMVGGQTNLALDMETITGATGLTVDGLSPEVVDPGNLPDSLGFTVASRVAKTLPTTFGYDPDGFFESVSGSIEHRGSILLGGSTALEIGNFTIVYDAAVGLRVIDNFDLVGLVLFDIVVNDSLIEAGTFDIWGEVKIANEFALELVDLGLTADDLTGTDVGDAWIQGFNQPVPGPGAGAFLALSLIGVSRRRRS